MLKSSTEQEMRTPITYYGGKQRMLPSILPKIPPHTLYAECFFGGGAVFFAKKRSQVEVVNDINHRLVTFYKALKYDFEDLSIKIDETFHSRAQHKETDLLYRSFSEDVADPVACAWAVWTQANMSFSSRIGGGFGYDKQGTSALRLFNKKKALTEAYQERMKRVTIECYDVLKVIKAYDSPETFFYLDPPYVSSDQGHYDGYGLDQFILLLDACTKIQGKFLLSSYPEEILLQYRKKYNWNCEDHVKTVAVSGKRSEKKVKTECLTWNYEL